MADETVRITEGLMLGTHTKVLAIFIVDDTTGLVAIEASRPCNEIGHIEGKETLAIETLRILLRQHKGFADIAFCINVTEIGSRIETIVAT